MKLHKTLHILEGDVQPLVFLGAIHFTVAGAHALFDISATSLLVAHLGADTLPQVYVGSAALLIAAGLFVIPVIDRLNRGKLFTLSIGVFATALAVSYYLGERAPEITYRGLYLVCYLMKSLLFLQYWLIAGDVCELRQAKRLFPILLGFSLAGGLAASLAASFLPRWLDTEDLLLVGSILLALTLVPLRHVTRLYGERLKPAPLRAKFRVRDTVRQLRSDLSVARGTPLLRNLSISFFLFALLAQVLDYLMGKSAGLHYLDSTGAVDPEALAAFYAALNVAVIGIGAAAQFLVANRIISSVGVTRGQLAGPLAFLVGFGSIGIALIATGQSLGAVFFFTVLASRAVQKVIRISIYRSSTDLIFNPIPSERRGRAKALKETVIEPMGALAGGLFLIFASKFEIGLLVGVSSILSVVFLATSMKLKTHYLDGLVHVLREKSRFRFAFPSTMGPDARPQLKETGGVVSDLERALDDDEVAIRLLAVEVAAELREPAAAPVLVRRFRQEPDERVRATMVAALGKLLKRRDNSLIELEPFLEDEDPRVRANGIEAFAQLGVSESSAFLAPFIGDDEPRIRANAAVAYGRIDVESGPEKAREILFEMSESGQEPDRLSSTYGLGEIGDETSLVRLETALHDPSASVRQGALMSLARSGRRQAIDRLVQLIEEGIGSTRHNASKALETCGDAAIDPLIIALWSSDVDTRRYIVRALGRIGSQRARQALVHILSLEAEEAYYDLLRIQSLQELPQQTGVQLLRDSLMDRVAQARLNALQVLYTVFGEHKGMRIILSNLNHPEPYVRASAIEALEVRVDPALIGEILPLFEHSNPKVVAEHGGSYFKLPSKQPMDVLSALAGERSRWIRACALYAAGQVGGAKALPLLERRLTDSYELARLNAIEAMGNLAGAASLPLLEAMSKDSEGQIRKYCRVAIAKIKHRSSP